MTRCLGLFLLACCGLLQLGSGLSCYKCSDYTGVCENVQECTDEDACLSLSEKGGKTVRQCIRYTDCKFTHLAKMFPSFAEFTFRCCTTNMCNSGNTVAKATPALTLVALLLSVCWSWM